MLDNLIQTIFMSMPDISNKNDPDLTGAMKANRDSAQ